MGDGRATDSRLPLEQARTKLATLWFVGAGSLFALLVVQSILGRYGKQVQQAWSWFIPTTVPTLSLMLGVLGSAALGSQDRRSVRRTFYDIAWWLSLFYLVILGATIVLQPLGPMDALELYQLSNYWLGPIQGLVVAAKIGRAHV